jgi:hypothetical protein
MYAKGMALAQPTSLPCRKASIAVVDIDYISCESPVQRHSSR